MDRSAWRMALARLSRRIWFRLALFTVGAVAVALAARAAGSWLPFLGDVEMGQDSVQPILQIVATSMLAVTTFSLTAMITSYASAAARATPRATQLLVEDPTSHRALSTFLGAFVFAIVGIIALSTGYYGAEGRTVLFAGTLAVIAIVVLTLVSWIHHLTHFGRMSDVLDRVERAAVDAAIAHARRPHLRGSPPATIPVGAEAVRAAACGVVTAIDMAALDRVAEGEGLIVHVVAVPGSAVGEAEPVARVEGPLTDEGRDAVRDAFLVERHRTFEQDPRLGPVALAEIAIRALSPAVNDPGTAIEALGAVQRVLTAHLTTRPDGEVAHARVHVPSVTLEDLVEDALRPIARDGAGSIEVALRIQRVVRALLAIAPAEDAGVLREASLRAERRALAALDDPRDRALLEEAAARARDAEAAAS